MAELPGELEDLVGELMEEEEDLFDEMEDAGSSWADSLDKGAGWDAADGPISNMSAKGVTGNRLPNTSEIGGRSGEGRQGKASGEFVGDTAVRKGGRKTPSRLAPDPFVKGQVKDISKDPVGGATGGGKESGVGGEGLEQIAGLSALEDLELRKTKITDADLTYLAGLKELSHLDLSETQITDAGLEALLGLSHLHTLILNGTQVTDAGVERDLARQSKETTSGEIDCQTFGQVVLTSDQN